MRIQFPASRGANLNGFMTHAKFELALLVGLLLIQSDRAATTVVASDGSGGDLSPGQIMKQVQDKYASLATYSDEGQATTLSGTITTFNTRLSRLAEPNQYYRIEWEQHSESSSLFGHNTLQAAWSSGRGYFLATASGVQGQGDLESALSAASVFSCGAAATIPRMFFNAHQRERLDEVGLSERRQTDEQLGDVDCFVLCWESPGRTNRLWIGKEDLLIRQVQTVMSAEAVRAMTAQANLSSELFDRCSLSFCATETHTNIIVNKQLFREDFVPSFPLYSSFNNE